MNRDTTRQQFEAWITTKPIEKSVERYSKNAAAWPGHYREYDVQLAWEAWHQATYFATGEVPSYD